MRKRGGSRDLISTYKPILRLPEEPGINNFYKHGKRKHVIEPDYYCFSLDDKSWVVGYGMDYKGKFRGLNYVGTIFN